MMKYDIRTTLASLSTGMMASATLLAAPPSGQDITRAIEAYNTKVQALHPFDDRNEIQLRVEAAKAAMKGVSLSEASVGQIRRLSQTDVIILAGLIDQAAERLATLAAQPGADGALAAVTRMDFLSVPTVLPEGATAGDRVRAEEATKVWKAAFRQAVNHRGLTAALPNGGGELFGSVRGVRSEVLASLAPELTRMAALIDDGLNPADAAQLPEFYEAVGSVDGLSATERERIRVRSLAVLRAAEERATDEAIRMRLAKAVKTLEGVAARGVLIGHKAPLQPFSWSSDSSIRSMDDLKGKVVIVDFWATWCGPCVGSFPHVRDLQARYKDFPVVVLGVTSLQGRHIDRPKGANGPARTIDTRADPAREHELMRTFIKQLGMSWPVVFTAESVYNPAFGVRGIPHVAIVDPAGAVRYNGLRLDTDIAAKYQMIDGLLREFQLPVPVADAAGTTAIHSKERKRHEKIHFAGGVEPAHGSGSCR